MGLQFLFSGLLRESIAASTVCTTPDSRAGKAEAARLTEVMSETSKAYSRGFYRGSRGAWPEHRPPAPPHEVLRPVIEAAQRLRDGADGICATLMDDDDFVKELGPLVDVFDEAMTKYGEWLREIESSANSGD